MNEIARIAQRRVDALQNEDAFYARRDQLRRDLELRGTSAVALEELRLLEEACAEIDAEYAARQADEIWAENAWLRAAEAPTPDDYAFEEYEARMGLV